MLSISLGLPYLSVKGDYSSSSDSFPSPLLGTSVMANWPDSSSDGAVSSQVSPEQIANLSPSVPVDYTQLAAFEPRVLHPSSPILSTGCASKSASVSTELPKAPSLSVEACHSWALAVPVSAMVGRLGLPFGSPKHPLMSAKGFCSLTLSVLTSESPQLHSTSEYPPLPPTRLPSGCSISTIPLSSKQVHQQDLPNLLCTDGFVDSEVSLPAISESPALRQKASSEIGNPSLVPSSGSDNFDKRAGSSPSSWVANILKDGDCLLQALKYYPPLKVEGDCATIFPPSGVIKSGEECWGAALGGFFYGRTPHFRAVNIIARKIWARFGLCHVAEIDTGFFLFHFSSVALMEFCLERGPWTISGCLLLLRRWKVGTPNLESSIKLFLCGLDCKTCLWNIGLHWGLVGLPVPLENPSSWIPTLPKWSE